MLNTKVIAICNQKGGLTKTISTANLGIGLAMQGKKVLLVDADPQGDLTTASTEFDEVAFSRLIKNIKILSPTETGFHLRCGLILKERRAR